MPSAHVPSLARGQVTPLVSQRGQGDARPARYVRSDAAACSRRQRATSPRPGGRAPPGILRRVRRSDALGPALSASGTGRTWCTTRAARRPGQPNGTWPGRCWRGRAVALRGIEPVHSLGRRPSREHGRHHGLWDGVTGTHAAPPIWTGGDSSAIASRGAQIGLFRAPASPGSAELRALSWCISIHALEYSLTISPLYGSPRGVFSIVLVGNQTADYERLPCLVGT
jgi:hypothetical protein